LRGEDKQEKGRFEYGETNGLYPYCGTSYGKHLWVDVLGASHTRIGAEALFRPVIYWHSLIVRDARDHIGRILVAMADVEVVRSWLRMLDMVVCGMAFTDG
jgi:hypothetical protein